MAVLETHIFDQKGMQHDICETIILQGGEQRWLLEHKHCHDLCRYKPEAQMRAGRKERKKKKKKEIIIQNYDNTFYITLITQTLKCHHI